MTISTTTTRVTYDGDGVTVAFAVPFPFFAASELEVIARDAVAGTETAKALGADYTVAGGDGAQGTVTALAAPPAAVQWVIRRKTARTQATDYTPNDPFPAETHEKALDRLTMIAQELGEESDRALVFPKTDGADLSAVLPPSLVRAGKVAAYDGQGQPTVSNLTLAGIEQGSSDASASASAAASSATAAATSETSAAVSAVAAATSATNALASSAAAEAAAASVGFSDVVFVTSSQSPITIGAADSGKLCNVDTSGGAVVITLPKISTLALPFTLGVKKATADANTVTINTDASDDFDDGTTAKVIASQYGTTLIPDTDPDPDSWTTVDWAGAAIPDGSITEAKLAAGAVATTKIADAAVTLAKLATDAIAGKLIGVQGFSASGTYTKTAGATKALVFCAGPGGGGGGGDATGTGGAAGSGPTSFGSHCSAGAGGGGARGQTVAGVPGSLGTCSGTFIVGLIGGAGNGGAGGCNYNGSGLNSIASDGGPGGLVISWITSGLGSTETVTVGTFGGGGSATNAPGNRAGSGWCLVLEFA